MISHRQPDQPDEAFNVVTMLRSFFTSPDVYNKEVFFTKVRDNRDSIMSHPYKSSIQLSNLKFNEPILRKILLIHLRLIRNDEQYWLTLELHPQTGLLSLDPVEGSDWKRKGNKDKSVLVGIQWMESDIIKNSAFHWIL